MDDENTGALDTLIEDGGDATASEGISTADEVAKYKELAENQRIRAEKAESKLKAKKEDKLSYDPEDIRKEARSTVREELENQYLEDTEYPDDIKEEIRKIAKLNNVSIRQAEKDSYVQYKIDQAVQEQRFKSSTVRNTRASVPAEDSTQHLDPKKFNLDTEEGRKAWRDAKAKREQ